VLANPQIRFLSECRHEMAPAVLDARTVHAFPASNSSNEQPIIVRVRAEPVEERPDPVVSQFLKLRRPRDPNQLAKLIVDMTTGAVPNDSPKQPDTPDTPATEARRKGGLKGGKARAKALPATKRKAIAKKAARARWDGGLDRL